MAVIFMSLVVTYLVTSAIMFPVQERVTKTKLVRFDILIDAVSIQLRNKNLFILL